MGARQKLNSTYLASAAVVSGFLGLVTQSIAVFIICFGVLAMSMLIDGSLRLKPTRR